MDTGDTEFEKQVEFEEQLITDHLELNNITATRDNSGIYYEVLNENTNGTPIEEEDIVSIRYIMKTLGGKLIDSLSMSEEVDTVVRFQHVAGAILPKGINFGVRLMNEGEKFRFYIPSYLAFGNYSYKTLLSSGAILVVDTEVVKVESEEDVKAQEKQAIQQYITMHQLERVSEKSSGIFYQILSEGTGEVVKTGQSVKVAYKGLYLNDEVFDESKSGEPISFSIGYSNIIKGFEEGIKLMKKGEKGRIFVPSDLAYGQGTQVIPGILRKDYLKTYNLRDMAPYQTLIFEVELKEVN
ncbi:FKBP-type peptidyl-prolyl cis-trans isomerase [Catalinimonas niigatensis]|uniref:FKBP-type peptidyl-prolyl cis-trans isomerase n=1 Tax=Catalinimonas niigatensis TaxID=1397264 RepID=UPI0026655FDE|nr:FKBP-type peptidyl-prolyl cis-trans isomerase [Catalinimonas niigatensis]WPP51621.1 FKBP-type peptidyl-prolyl cis-trans isomerase [Catalinimonas niigatensis]